MLAKSITVQYLVQASLLGEYCWRHLWPPITCHQMQSHAVYYTVKCISLHSALADGRLSDMDRPRTANPQVYIRHSISHRNFCCFSYIIAMVHQNSPTVEFWQEKIEGNLRRANTEPSVDFRRANTEPSVDFRKANTEPSVHFRRANTETY